jgi:hypothetical protein
MNVLGEACVEWTNVLLFLLRDGGWWMMVFLCVFVWPMEPRLAPLRALL